MYCNNNPVVFIDPDGMDFTLSGQDAQEWVEGLQNAMNTAQGMGSQVEINWETGNIYTVERDAYDAMVATSGGGGGPIFDFFERVNNYSRYGEYVTNNEFNKKYSESIEVLLWDKVNDKDVGHTAIKVNGIVYGYYPTDINGDGNYTSEDLDNSPGIMHKHNSRDFIRDYYGESITSYTVKVTVGQKRALLEALNSFAENPGQYSLIGNQCTSVALKAMARANIKISNGRLISSYFERNFNIVSPNQLRSILSSYSTQILLGM